MSKSHFDRECDKHVAEMISLGAVFSINRSGHHPTWAYEPEPVMRNAIRRYLDGIDRGQIGFDAAMVRAILRLKYSGAP